VSQDVNSSGQFVTGNVFEGNVLKRKQINKIIVTYLTTDGYINNLNSFDLNTLTIDTNRVTAIHRCDPFDNGAVPEDSDKIRTLAPVWTITLNKIITSDDMTVLRAKWKTRYR
jgi:hypothetical protein